MDRPNFAKMSLEEFRAYVLSHRQDDEAIYAYCDRRQKQKSQKDIKPVSSKTKP